MSERAECIAFANHKGGTGKTTSCLSIAGCLAKAGNKVLVIDLDPQANATSGLGIDATSLECSIYDVVLGQCGGYEGVPISRAILETDVEKLHVAPSEFDLAVAEVVMQEAKGRTGILSRALAEIGAAYDYILIDLLPGSGLLTINGLCASDQIVVPLEPSIFSLEALENLKISLDDIGRMAGHRVRRVTAVLVRYVRADLFSRMLRRPNPSQEVDTRLREMFDRVFVIPESGNFYGAQREGMPISHYAPGSRAARAYEEVARSLSSEFKRKSDAE